ncbi:MAG: HAMP domain-containing protein [Anaerolineae bacterium]|nr:HAMP domain-containing protein [Anaerolineae bacterium]
MRARTRIGTRLVTAFLAAALLALTSGVIGLVALRQTSYLAEKVIQDAEMIAAVQEIRVAAGPLLTPLDDFVSSGDGQAAGRFATALQQLRERLAIYQEVHRRHDHSAPHATSAQSLMTSTVAGVDRLEQLGNEILAGDDPAAQEARLAESEALLATTMSRLDELLHNAEEDVASAKAALLLAEQRAFLGLGASALLSVLFATALALMITRSISRPLAELATAAERIAGGELSSPITVQGPGEIARLSQVLDDMRTALLRERGQLRLLAVLEERDRIGREMHDGLAQVLGYVNTKAQAVREFLRRGQPDRAERQIEELVTAAQEAYTDAREAIDGLRMDGMHERGLLDVLQEIVERFGRRSDAAVHLTVAGSWQGEAISATVQIQLLRIVQEALTNIRKHAQASQVDVYLERDNGQAQIRITDDGIGFPLSRLLQPDYDRYGLRTMRERTNAIGGTFRIESAPERGTTIFVRVPLRPGKGNE